MIPRGTHVSCRFRYSVIASLTISRKDIPFLMARYFILVWMLLLIRKLQCTGTSVVSETDTGGAGVVSVTICSLLGFFVEERSPLRPPFIPSFNILLLLMAMLFWLPFGLPPSRLGNIQASYGKSQMFYVNRCKFRYCLVMS